jgi:hypothetical protein
MKALARLLTLNEMIVRRARTIAKQRASLDDGLASVETWIEGNAHSITEADCEHLSRTLESDRSILRADSAHVDTVWLVISALRIHAMRLLHRFYESSHAPMASSSTDGVHARARDRFARALREAEIAILEARADLAIANAYARLDDCAARRRWLEDALGRLENQTSTDLIELADSIPPDELPRLDPVRELAFRILGREPAEIARRRLRHLRAGASLHRGRLVEIAQLLAASLAAVEDKSGARKAVALLTALNREPRPLDG